MCIEVWVYEFLSKNSLQFESEMEIEREEAFSYMLMLNGRWKRERERGLWLLKTKNGDLGGCLRCLVA